MGISGKMKELIGKKLIWVGGDEDHIYLVFENMQAVGLYDEPTLLENAGSVLKMLLSEQLESAHNMVTLKQLMEEIK